MQNSSNVSQGSRLVVNWTQQILCNEESIENYQKDYEYLNQNHYQGQFVEIFDLKLQPNLNNFSLGFYQALQEKQQTNQQKGNRKAIQSLEKLIVTIKINNLQNYKKTIKLPKVKTIYINLQTNKDGIIQGQLSLDSNSPSISLQNSQGIEKAILSYKVSSTINKSLQQSQIKEQNRQLFNINEQSTTLLQNTLHEKISQSVILNNTKDNSQDNKMAAPLEIVSGKNVVLSTRGKVKHCNNYTFQIDYCTQDEPEQTLHNRISSYKMPLISHKTPQQTTQRQSINLKAVRKNQQELGISNRKIEHLFQNKYEAQNQSLPEYVSSPIGSKLMDTIVQSPQKVQNKRQNWLNNQFYREVGIGTYTPLASRMASITNSSNSNKSTKSTKLKKDYVVQIIKQYEEGKKQRKRQELSIEHYNIINAIPEQPIANQSTYRIPQLKNLSYKAKVMDVKVDNKRTSHHRRLSQEQISEIPSQKRRILSQHKQSQSSYYEQFDLLINNINVNFHKKIFGNKYVEIEILPNIIKTEELIGSNLIWIGKNYLFQTINSGQQMIISVKENDDMKQITVGKVKINLSDIFNNKKQSYYQTLLLGKKEILANVLIGFEIMKKVKREETPINNFGRHYHSAFRTKTTHLRAITKQTNIKAYNQQLSFDKMPQSRSNLIKMRKYLGGKNIKIGKSSRFYDEHEKDLPGPGDYQIQSSFSRHAYKQL